MADGSAADRAYEAALREIERVKTEGGTNLVLALRGFAALDRIPPEVANIEGLKSIQLHGTQVSDLSVLREITSLQEIILSGTKVSDISPLRNLTKLKYLDLNRTAVADITPLRDLIDLSTLYLSSTNVTDISVLRDHQSLYELSLGNTKVADISALHGKASFGVLHLSRSLVADLRPLVSAYANNMRNFYELTYRDTPAMAQDAELARIAKEADREDKLTSWTIAYLKTLPPWPEPLPWNESAADTPPPPEQDSALPLIWGEKGFAFLARSIDSDPVTEAALEDLRALLEDLRRKGNRHDDLYRLAGEMQERAAGEIAELNMVRLHLSYQKLRRLYQSRDQRGERFDDETVGVLGSVLEILPGVTLADPGVEKLIQRQEAERLAGTNPQKAQAEAGVLMTLQAEDAPFADEVRDAARAILEPGQNDRLAATRGILSRNSLIAVLTFFTRHPVGAGITSSVVATYAIAYGPALLTGAAAIGTDTLLWAQMVLASVKAEYQLTAGLAREALSSGATALPRRRNEKKD